MNPPTGSGFRFSGVTSGYYVGINRLANSSSAAKKMAPFGAISLMLRASWLRKEHSAIDVDACPGDKTGRG
jgi:hypothetical protein